MIARSTNDPYFEFRFLYSFYSFFFVSLNSSSFKKGNRVCIWLSHDIIDSNRRFFILNSKTDCETDGNRRRYKEIGKCKIIALTMENKNGRQLFVFIQSFSLVFFENILLLLLDSRKTQSRKSFALCTKMSPLFISTDL